MGTYTQKYSLLKYYDKIINSYHKINNNSSKTHKNTINLHNYSNNLYLSQTNIIQPSNLQISTYPINPIETYNKYIYNLQTLFNTAHNKYKDFKRTIENKKQVYEKLLSTNKIEELTEEEIHSKLC